MNMTREADKGITPSSSFYADDNIDIKKIIELLYRHAWIILSTGLVTFFIAFLYTFTIKPQYISSTLIQITSHSNANMLANPFTKGNESTNQAQLALLKTRYVLEPLVIKNGLNVVVRPRYFPFFGEWKANRYTGEKVARPFLGLKSYAWGGEEIRLKQFNVPTSLIGTTFKLIAGITQTYKLYTSDDKLLLTGIVGKPITASNGIIIEIEKLKANSGTKFFVSYQSPISVAQSLGRSMRINTVQGNDPTISTGISEIQLVSNDPHQAVNILNEIVNFATIKNAKQKSIETQKTLEFLNKKLPEVSNTIKQSEEEISQYHTNKGVFSANIASATLTQKWGAMSQSLELLKTEREELLQIYTPLHPLVISLELKIKRISAELENIKKQITKLPSARLVEQRLDREVKLKSLLFNMLYNNKQQLELVKAGVVSDIRVLTDATPASRMPSHKLIILLFGLFAGIFGASLFILVKNMFVKTVETADQLEAVLHLPVQTVVPFSRKQKQLEKTRSKLGLYATPLILAKLDPEDITIESLRSLQVNLQITNASSNQVIALMGSMSNIGKSFVSLNLSQVLAESGKKTLLIDADVRRGALHKILLEPKENGLSEHLEGKVKFQDLIRQIHDNLFFIPSGIFTLQPIELFRNPRFKQLIDQVRNNFDHIIIDTPPLLPVSDAILIAQQCDTKLFIVSAGKDSIKDVQRALKKASNNKIDFSGIILNHRKPLTPYGSRHESRYSYKVTV